MRPPLRDLFGDVPVTLDDVLRWMLAVPGIPPDSPRWGRYVRDYAVPDKIRAAKLAGTFDQVVTVGDVLSTARGAGYAIPARLTATRVR